MAALVGPLPLPGDPAIAAATVLKTLRAYRTGAPTAPPDDVSVLKLAIAGLYAHGFGGRSALPITLDGRASRHPAALEPFECYERFKMFVHGLGGLDAQDFEAVTTMVLAGMEALGLTPSTAPSWGRRKRPGSSAEPVRAMLAEKYRDVVAGRLNLASALRQCARDAILDRKRETARKHKLDAAWLGLTREDEQDVEYLRRTMEIAYHRQGPVTDIERRNRRNLKATVIRAIRNRRASSAIICKQTVTLPRDNQDEGRPTIRVRIAVAAAA